MSGFLRTLVRPWSGRFSESRFEGVVRLAVPILYMCAIFFFSSLPGDRVPKIADDRIEHTVAYVGFGLTLWFGVAGLVGHVEPRHAVGAWLFGVLYGASDEWHQRFVPGRDSSLKDLTFDTLGLTVALLLLAAMVMRARTEP